MLGRSPPPPKWLCLCGERILITSLVRTAVPVTAPRGETADGEYLPSFAQSQNLGPFASPPHPRPSLGDLVTALAAPRKPPSRPTTFILVG